MPSGWDLFAKAEEAYAQRPPHIDEAIDYYQRAIKKIIKDEDVTASMPPMYLSQIRDHPSHPREVLGSVWMNFTGLLKDPVLKRNKENSSEAFNLLMSFRPGSTHNFSRFRSDQAKVMLKGMRISAALTLGLSAWDRDDRPAAMKYHRSALDLAAEHEPYNDEAQAQPGWETFIATEVRNLRENIVVLLSIDEINARGAAETFGEAGQNRKEIVDVAIIRREGDGRVTFVEETRIASDKCASCGKRDAKLQKCGACHSVVYCSSNCQTTHWPSHRVPCKAKRNQ